MRRWFFLSIDFVLPSVWRRYVFGLASLEGMQIASIQRDRI